MPVKPALGRDLGTLLGNQSPAGTTPAANAPAASSQPGPGVRSLLRGHRTDVASSEVPAALQPVLPLSTAPEQAAQSQAPIAVQAALSKRLIPPWYLFAADVLVVALAVVLVFAGGPISWGQRLFYMALVALGGCFGIGGVLLSDQEE